MIKKARNLHLFLLVVWLFSCGQVNKPNELMFGLNSYMTIDEVRTKTSGSSNWEVIEHTKNDDDRPEYDLLMIETSSRFAGQKEGRTVITFFNDELMEVRFYPSPNIAMDISINSVRNVDKPNGMQCWSARDIHEKLFFACKEEIISEKHEKWLARYS